jgi:hypothetical protein
VLLRTNFPAINFRGDGFLIIFHLPTKEGGEHLPEIMGATLHILKEAGALIDIHEVEIGEKV